MALRARLYLALLLSSAMVISTAHAQALRAEEVSTSGSAAELPEAPEVAMASTAAPFASFTGGQSDVTPTRVKGNVAKKYAGTIPGGVEAQPLEGMDKERFMLHQLVSPYSVVSSIFSAGWSHALNTSPRYGTNSTAFAQRFGASMATGAVETITVDGVLAPLLHDDPRYYQLGPRHNVAERATYAAERVFVTRSDSGKNRVNIPKLLGYAVADGVKTTYYPDKDRNQLRAWQGYVASLSGAVIGMEINEFLSDAVNLVRHNK